MTVLFDGPFHMHEHTAYVLSGDSWELPSRVRRSRVNSTGSAERHGPEPFIY